MQQKKKIQLSHNWRKTRRVQQIFCFHDNCWEKIILILRVFRKIFKIGLKQSNNIYDLRLESLEYKIKLNWRF